jgi:uncharacterized RDD family membrane protein YckC
LIEAESMTLASTPVATATPLYAQAGRALRRRLIALLVDTAVVALLDVIVNRIFGVTRPTGAGTIALVSGGIGSVTTQTVADWPWLTLLWLAYYALLEGMFGATVGKAIVGLRVTDLYGRRLGWKSAMTRNLARIIDFLPVLYLIGGSLTLVTREHQRLGDRAAQTLVLPVDAITSPPLSEPAVRRRVAILAALLAIVIGYSGWFAYFGRPPLVIEGAVNTSVQTFAQGVSRYSLGAPRWGNGTVSYPITYQTEQTNQSCQGEITLLWNGFPPGWEISGGDTHCSPRIYP